MTRCHVLVVVVAALIAGACSGTTLPSAAPPSPTASATAAVTAAPTAAATAELVVGGDRPVTVHVPASYDASQPAPLLILLHGYGASGDEIDRYFALRATAERRGFVYATPDGTISSNGSRFWNATDACCDFDRANVDDVAYLSGVIADIQRALAIDPKRIAVVGHSNGGFMSYRMACERSDVVAAIVSLAGETFADPADCKPSEPVSVAQVQGTADEVVRFDGGGPFSADTGPHPGATTTAEAWATYDGCGPRADVLSTRIDVDGGIADGTDPAETSVQEWSGCDGGATVQLWTIPSGRHSPALTPAFGDAVVRFLVDHPKR